MLYFKPEVYFKDKIDELLKSDLYINLKLACNEVYPDKYELKIENGVDKDDYIDFAEYFLYAKKNTFNLKLTIYFPEVIVTNRDLLQHTIKDLYFIMVFNKQGNNWNLSFKGKRSTYSINEINSNYNHSHLMHLNINNINEWKDEKSWCLGASELVNYKTLYNPTKDNLQMLLLLLPNYISYESIEGRPYKYIKNIGISKTGVIFISIKALERLYENHKKQLKFKLNSNLEISNFEEFEENLEIKEYNDNYFVYKINNNYYPVNQNHQQINGLDNQFLFNFNNKPIYSKVENKITEIKSKKYAHPAITRYFAKRIAKDIKELYHRKYGETSESNYTTESKRTDYVLM